MGKLRKFSVVIFAATYILMSATSVFAQSEKEAKTQNSPVEIAPAKESTINGIPESKLIQPMIIGTTPVFVNYTPSTYYHNDFFQLIAETSLDNTLGAAPAPLTLKVDSSTRQGSDWTTSLSLNGEFKVQFLAKLSATIGGTYKEFRETNEAIGTTTTISVPAGKNQGLLAYWGGEKTSGTIYYKYPDSSSGTGYTPVYSTSFGAFVHTTHFDVHYKVVNK